MSNDRAINLNLKVRPKVRRAWTRAVQRSGYLSKP
ncbi:hypothetical protein CCACVL1_05357, partial [Corchorus capsularis]